MSFWDWKTGHRFQSLDTTAQPGSLDAEAGIMSSTFDRSGLRLICGEADKTSMCHPSRIFSVRLLIYLQLKSGSRMRQRQKSRILSNGSQLWPGGNFKAHGVAFLN